MSNTPGPFPYNKEISLPKRNKKIADALRSFDTTTQMSRSGLGSRSTVYNALEEYPENIMERYRQEKNIDFLQGTKHIGQETMRKLKMILEHGLPEAIRREGAMKNMTQDVPMIRPFRKSKQVPEDFWE